MQTKTKMRTIDKQEAITLLERAVAERGADWVYPRYAKCCYTVSGDSRIGRELGYAVGETGPACMVGLALSYAIPSELDAAVDEDAFVSVNGNGVQVLAKALRKQGVRVTKDALELMNAVQDRQDGRKPWGQALQQAML